MRIGAAPTRTRAGSNLGTRTGLFARVENFIEALLQVSNRFRFSMGVEWVKSAETARPIRLSWTDATVAEVIQGVVSTQAGYEWRVEEGVVHVFQRDLMQDRRNPLDVNIDSFGKAPETVGGADNDLRAMVSEIVRHPEWAGIAGSVISYPGEPKFSFAADHVPARAILNQIVNDGVTAGRVIWVATYPDPPKPKRLGFLEPLPFYQSQENSPFWVVLNWGNPPPQSWID